MLEEDGGAFECKNACVHDGVVAKTYLNFSVLLAMALKAITRELKVVRRTVISKGQTYEYGSVNVVLPAELIGKRVKVMVLFEE